MSSQVKFETSIGDFTVELYGQHCPKACFNLENLAKIGYYDNTIIHRIVKDFMVQMGDPTGTGRGIINSNFNLLTPLNINLHLVDRGRIHIREFF